MALTWLVFPYRPQRRHGYTSMKENLLICGIHSCVRSSKWYFDFHIPGLFSTGLCVVLRRYRRQRQAGRALLHRARGRRPILCSRPSVWTWARSWTLLFILSQELQCVAAQCHYLHVSVILGFLQTLVSFKSAHPPISQLSRGRFAPNLAGISRHSRWRVCIAETSMIYTARQFRTHHLNCI